MDKKEFWRQADDTKAYPFVVTYQDRATFPPQRFYATREAAFAEKDGAREVMCIMERRVNAGAEECREIFGTMWPKKEVR